MKITSVSWIGPESGSVVVIDCASGDILAMASMPAFDPNIFSRGITHDEWDMLSADDHLPLVNKTLQGLYPPGSTVKPMNALALLEAGVDPGERVDCTGRYKVGNSYFHCWKHGGHGPIDMHHAIAQSCDIYFYTMARRIGTERIVATARKLGLGQSFPLPFTSQRYGTVPDPAWKLRRYKSAWTVADTLNASIGQGYTLANPLQLAVMAARIGSGKTTMPRILHRLNDRQPEPLDISNRHLAIVRAAMGAVVGVGGTANAARLHVPGVAMAGKTGSAQVRHISAADRAAGRVNGAVGTWKLRDHGLFVGFAPVEAPRYACGIVLEHGGHGAAAALIARDALSYMFDQKSALATLADLERGWGGGIEARLATQAGQWRAAHPKPGIASGPPGVAPPPPEPPASAAATAEAPPDESSDVDDNQAGPIE